MSKLNDLIQMDYVVLTADLTFGKHRYILNAIDVLSKKAYTRSPPTTSSTDATAAQTLVLAKQIFDEIKAEHGSYPKRLQTIELFFISGTRYYRVSLLRHIKTFFRVTI